jgi:hypothetical protein
MWGSVVDVEEEEVDAEAEGAIEEPLFATLVRDMRASQRAEMEVTTILTTTSEVNWRSSMQVRKRDDAWEERVGKSARLRRKNQHRLLRG